VRIAGRVEPVVATASDNSARASARSRLDLMARGSDLLTASSKPCKIKATVESVTVRLLVVVDEGLLKIRVFDSG
jgi:hypothetical protein